MSFKQLNKDVLEQVAEEFAVEWSNQDPTKNEMIKDLEDEGVTWDMYKQAFPDPEDQDETPSTSEADEASGDSADVLAATKNFSQSSGNKVLVRMTRGNGTFQVRGYSFTKAHPFLPVSADDAEYLVNDLGGFKIATPREADEYYS